jgi:predicted secreted Zn-dependent protease
LPTAREVGILCHILLVWGSTIFGLGTRRLSIRRGLVFAIAVAAAAVPTIAAVTIDTQYRYYKIGGTTEREIVRYMKQHPYTGDSGHAYANIKHRYNMDLTTKQVGAICKVERLDLDIDFTITLPQSANPAKLTSRAKQSFNAFASFAKRHEEHHRASFVDCGRAFVAKARQKTAAQCFSLASDIRALLRKADKDCEAKQRAFDRQQTRTVHGLALFARGRR